MIKHKLYNNLIDSYIAITVEKPLIASLTKEESYALPYTDGTIEQQVPAASAPDYDSTASEAIGQVKTHTLKNYQDRIDSGMAARTNLSSYVPSSISPTDYIGAFSIKIPYTIDQKFANFQFLSLLNNPFSTLQSSPNLVDKQKLWENLFEDGDTNRIATIFPGQQLLRIPSNVFNTGVGVITTFEATLTLDSEIILITSSNIILAVGSGISGEGIPEGTTILAFANNIAILSNTVIEISSGIYTKVTLTNTVTSSSTITKNLGKYYVRVSPKYIDLNILEIHRGQKLSHNELSRLNLEHDPLVASDVLQTDIGNRETTIITDFGIPYNSNTTSFKDAPISEGTNPDPWNLFKEQGDQNGQLIGSICEVIELSSLRIKSTKVIAENSFIYDSTLKTYQCSFVLSPELLGYESIDNQIAVNDGLRIYPRETYFDPIFIEVDYTDNTTIEDLIKYSMNDAVRDTKTGIIEIYDNNGIAIDSQGNVNGTVVESFQLSQQNNLEIRKKINIDTANP